MRKPGFFQTLIGSFYNPETYRDVVKNKKGTTFAYLAILVLLCTIPLIVSVVTGMNSFMKDDGTFILDQAPEIRITNGIVSMDKESPYFIKSQAGEILFVIDVSDSASIKELQGSAKVLLTKNKLIGQQQENETRTYDLSKVENFTLNAQKIRDWFGYAWIVYIIIFIFMLIFFYIYRLIQAFVNGVFGLLISAVLKVNLDFTSLIYISMVAITPVAILASIIWSTDVHIPAKGWLGFILAMGYISFGIMSNKPLAPDFNTSDTQNEIGGNNTAQ
jgi:hypothetical protein